MTSMKAKQALRSRRQASTRSTRKSDLSRIGQFENLESRELLSSFHPDGATFQWFQRGRIPVKEVRFDEFGACTASFQGGVPTDDCALGSGAAPQKVVIPFSTAIDRRSFNAKADVSFSITTAGQTDSASRLQVIRGTVRGKTLTLVTAGHFAGGADSELTLSVRGIQGKKPNAVWMDPWTITVSITSEGSPPPPPPTPLPDTVAPQVVQVIPATGSTLTQAPTFIEATFSEDLDPATIKNPANTRLIANGGAARHPSQIIYDPATDRARFAFSGNWPNAAYTFRLSTGIRDLAGNPLSSDFTSTFQLNVRPHGPQPTFSPGDITPPTVTSVTPGPEAVLNGSPSVVLATFSEPLDPSTINAGSFRVVTRGDDGSFGNSDDRVVAVQSVQYHPSSRQAMLVFAETLHEDAYRVELAATVRDLAGNQLDGTRDGQGGTEYVSEFRVDTTAPSLQAGLASASDTGLAKINRTNRPNNIVFGGSVNDGTLWSPSGYTVRLDVDGDGFDDGESITDASGNFVVTAPSSYVATGSRSVRLQVTDLAGHTGIVRTSFEVDTIRPMIGFPAPMEVHPRAPASLTVLFSELMNPIGAQDLKNYKLYASGRDGQFFDHTVSDVSHFLTAARYDAPNNKVTLSLAAGLPPDSYRLVVRSNGTIEDVAGNKPAADGLLELRIGGLTRTSLPRPTNRPPIDPTTIRQFPQYDFTAYETMDPHRSYQNQVTVRRSMGPVVNPNAILQFSEQELPLGPAATNNAIDTCETLTLFGQDPNEDPLLVLRGTDFGTADVDTYCFQARAGENVKFSITDQFGIFLPTFPNLIIWDLGSDGRPGGSGDAADRQLVAETLVQFFLANNRPIFSLDQIIPDFVDVEITGLTGRAMDRPEDQVLNPLGSERREPQDRTFALQIDTDRLGGNVVQPYLITGEFSKPAPSATDQQQIIFVDFDGAQNVRGFEDSSVFQNPILVNVPAFDVRDYGLDPMFQDEFIDRVMADLREEFERVRLQSINVGQNSSFGIRPFSYELRDSRHFPDPGNLPNVTRIHIGGSASIADLPLGVIGIAEEVDTGNRRGTNNVLVFSKDLAQLELTGVSPLGFGPSRIPELAEQIAFVAAHESGHVLGQWHTRAEGLEFCDFDANPNCPPDFDNIIDPILPPLGLDVHHRFDRYRDFGFTVGGVTVSAGLEFFEGVADSIGVLAWGMTGRDQAPPRVLSMEVSPGQIQIVFSEGIDPATLSTGFAPTITLERADFDNDFTTSVPVALLPIGTRGPASGQTDPCLGPVPTGVSLYDVCTSTLTLQVADINEVVLNDKYRLTLVSTFNRSIKDNAGNSLDGEINLPVNQRISPRGELFPSGNSQPGGSFQFDFLVTDIIAVDGDISTVPAGTPGTMTAPFSSIQVALEAAQFANLRQSPVHVRIAPAISPYLAFEPRLDPTPLTTSDQGAIVIPKDAHLELDANFEIGKVLFVVTPRPDDPATPANESAVLPGTIYRVDANSANGGPARILGSFLAPVPTPGNAGLAFDGSSLFFVHDAAGSDSTTDTVFVLDPVSGVVLSSFSVPTAGTAGRNIDGLGVDNSVLYASDSEANTILRLDKRTGALISSFATSFDLVGGLDIDATTHTLWTSSATTIHQVNPRTGQVLATFAAPPGVTEISGIGLEGGEVFVADRATDKIYRLDRTNPANSESFNSPALDPSALAGVPRDQLVVKLLGTRIEAAGTGSALRAIGKSIDEPVIFTSTRDTTVMGRGASSAAPADWMGIAFRPGSDDFASRLENVAVRFAGGPGTLVPGLTQTLSAITLFDARPAIVNTEISNNTEAAIAATPDSFERLLGRSGPELFWDVDAGVPIAGDWCTDDPATPAVVECAGIEFGLFQSSTGKLFLDRNGNRALDESERPLAAFGSPGDTAVVGNFNPSIPGDEIAVLDRRTGLWTIDRNRDFIVSLGVPGLPDDDIAVQFGQHADIAIVGDWNGTGADKIGVFRAHPRLTDSECLEAARVGAACFILDLNNNLQIDTGEDFVFGMSGDVPVIGNFASTAPGDEFGVYRSSTGEFSLDRNGDRTFNPGEKDNDGDGLEDPDEVIGEPDGMLNINDGPIAFGSPGATPAIGDWDASTPGDEIGVVTSAMEWLVDSNANLVRDASEVAIQFGQAGDIPAWGDWAVGPAFAGDEFGLFRPTAGLWIVDADSDNTVDPSEDLDRDGNLDVNEDLNGNSVLDAGEDIDNDGRLDVAEDVNGNGMLDRNDGPFSFSGALRNGIEQFIFNNSLNAVWVKPGFQTVADAHWDDVQIPYVLTSTVEVQALSQIGVVPTLQLEPGLVVKMGTANLSVGGFGSTLLIDSDLEIGEPRVVFTSLLDDEQGPNGRRHDTNNDRGALTARPGDWGGIVISPGATAIINGADIAFAGNLRVPARTTPGQSFFPNTVFQNGLVSPNPITLNGGPIFATITHNIISSTNNLNNTSSPRTLPSDVAAIGVVGGDSLGPGPNRARIPFNTNPFIRGNDVSTENGLNGLEIRTDLTQPALDPAGPNLNDITHSTFISQDSVWDDTDITHILLGTLNWATVGPLICAFITQFPGVIPGLACSVTLSLRSNPAGTFDEFDGVANTPAESLVVKLGGRFNLPFSLLNPFPVLTPPSGVFFAGVNILGAGFQMGWDDGNANTAFQDLQQDWGTDSILQVEGVAGNADLGIKPSPVVFTSIRDDSIGARGQEDTNNDATTTLPAPGDWAGLVFGAWARNFGRVSPHNGAQMSSSFVRDADIRFASTGVLAQSQPMEISNTIIRSSRDFGIRALQGPNIADQPPSLTFNPNNEPRLPAAIQAWNNILVANAIGIQQEGGADNANFIQESKVPRSLIMNNTLHANTTAIALVQRSGPLIMNNAITGSGGTGTGITIDATSLQLPFETPPQHEMPLLLRNLFFGLANNGFTGSLPRGLGGQEILGVDPLYTSPSAPDFNFRPNPGSPLVDSAVSEFGRPIDPVFDFFDPLWGLVRAPDRDKLGAFRRDHAGTPNVGIGQRPWLDMGAIELVDVISALPRVVSMVPVPNSNFPNGFGPAAVELEFSEPVTGVGSSTFFVEASGGDQGFTEGNETRLIGQVSAVPGTDGTRWTFTPNAASSFNNFQNELFRVTAIGTGGSPIVSVANDVALDGEFSGSFPSGDGVEGGDFHATFSIGEVIGRALYVDDTAPACPGVPRNDPNLMLFPTIAQALANAQPGDFILVCPGVYTQQLTPTVPVTIESLEGALPRKDSLGRLIPGTGTFISVPVLPVGATAAIRLANLSTEAPMRIGSTRGGVNRGFVITTSPISGASTTPPAGIGIEVIGTAAEIEGNLIVSNTIGIRADTLGAARLPNITNNVIVGNTAASGTGTGAGGAGIDITSRHRDALARIINNTVSYNQAGILLREDGLDAQGRVVATVQNNNITSNTLTGLSTVSARAFPNVFHNNAWGNANQSSNFGGTLPNLPPSASDLAGNPIPDAVCTPTLTRCGNISVNPFFINPVDPRNVSDRAEFFRIANFELQSASKLIDRAKDKDSPARDFKGRTRTIDIPGVGNETSPPPSGPDSEPRSVDIGAFEFVAQALASSTGLQNAFGDPGTAAATASGQAAQNPGGDSIAGDQSQEQFGAELQLVLSSGVGTEATDDMLGELASQFGFSTGNRFKTNRLASLVDEWLDQRYD